ncbi:uncharacterized protein LOC111247080 [Varroa destructor]|uniref:Uncharacterized protein n=1 Tax=Varroa destructor TaxID=109461 RepID=A0A7M7JL53_VARDE|nr:uncharacterized protein LOC111247080 [Varroa destructor]XP_022653370.1 uncharacterized protein LOC111247080 [Varroa destructor]
MLAAMSVVSEGSVHDGSNSLQAVASRSLLEMKGSFRTATHTKESVANGLFLNLLYHRPSTDSDVDHRRGKKQLIIEALTHLVLDVCYVKLSQTAQDTLIALYDSTDDLTLLALANLATAGGIQLPKILEQSVVELMETVDTGATTDELQLLSASIVMGRAIDSATRELTTLLTHACSLLVKDNVNKETPLHLPALLCLRSYLHNARVLGDVLPPEILTGSGLVEKFHQKIIKHRPAFLSREVVSFMKVVSSLPYANIIRQLFKDASRDDATFRSILQMTAVKFPADTLEIYGKVFSISPKEAIPLHLLTSIVDTLIESRGNEIITEIIRFCFSCLETSALLVEFFGCYKNEETETEQFQKYVPLIEVYRSLKEAHKPAIIWPAAALRFIRHPLVEEALADGSLHHYIEYALQGDSAEDKIVALLLLCPQQQSLRLPVNSKIISAEPPVPEGASCANCIMAEAKFNASEAARDAATRSLTSALIRLRDQEEAVSKMRAQVAKEALESSRRIAEAKVLQTQICVTEKRVTELRNELEQCEGRLTAAVSETAELKTRNEETMTALKQTRRDVEKLRSEGDKKRTECQNLQRELVTTREQLTIAKKKIDDLEVFKEKLNCLMGSFPSK